MKNIMTEKTSKQPAFSINISGGIERYTDTNAINLRNLFARIKKEEHIGNREFAEKYRPLILEQIIENSDPYPEQDPFWGAWFLAEDNDDHSGASYDRALGAKAMKNLWNTLSHKDMPGEAVGYLLCLFCGLSVTDAMNARYRDIFPLESHFGEAMIHVRGAFPKRPPATEYDIRPRFVPLPAKLYGLLLDRLDEIRARYTFPVVTEETVFKDPEDLPIACRGTERALFSRIRGLSTYATGMLRDAGFKEISFSYAQKDLLEEPLRFMSERSAAYAIGRHSYARVLHAAGISTDQAAYLLGHPSPGEEDNSFFGDENWTYMALTALSKTI